MCVSVWRCVEGVTGFPFPPFPFGKSQHLDGRFEVAMGVLRTRCAQSMDSYLTPGNTAPTWRLGLRGLRREKRERGEEGLGRRGDKGDWVRKAIGMRGVMGCRG